MIYYFMLFSAAVCITLTTVIDKLYQKGVAGLNNLECALRKSIPGGILCALLFFAAGKFRVEFSWFSFWMGCILSVINVASTLICFKAYEQGNISLFTMFRMQGGMLLPYIYGVIFADNKPSICQIIGIVVMVLSLLIPYLGKRHTGGEAKTEKNPFLYTLLCIAVFIMNGGISVVSYIQSNSASAIDSTSFLTIYQMQTTVVFILVYAVWCLIHKRDNLFVNPPVRTKRQTLVLLLYICLFAAIGAVGYFLQLVGAAHLPAVVIYPMVTGGTVVLTALSGLVFFKEKLSVKGYIGIFCTFIATILFVF